ncbi:restriction endonuclease [Aliarcobacter butzleri]|uniref:restriction endonuclease n=1 Tax=Aliarcobacter butzleri TaxID=28197 RepID=UPI003AFB6641
MPNITDSLLQGLSHFWFFPLILIAIGVFKILIIKLEKKHKIEKRIDEVQNLREKKLEEIRNQNQNTQNNKIRQREFYKKNEEKGINFELLAGRKFEELGYKVQYNGLEKSRLDGGIDLICTKVNQKTLLVQCKNYSKPKSITHEHIKVFHSNAMKYIKDNNLNENNIELKYVIPDKDVLDISAIKVMMNDFYRCKYLIVV